MSFKKHVGKYVFSFIKPKPKPTTGESFKVWGKKASGKFKKALEIPDESIDKVLTQSRKLLQEAKGEKVTKSGLSKGKDIKK